MTINTNRSAPADPRSQPIINSPYHAPDYHWQLDTQAKAIGPANSGRRQAQNVSPVSRQSRKPTTFDEQHGALWAPLHLVNDVRCLVQKWQADNYPGTTPITKALIRHWVDYDEERDYYVYFAQLDAVLSHIFIMETEPTIQIDQLQNLAKQFNRDIFRIAHKMATGTGKTITMAMLIVWQTANHLAAPDDDRFTDRFLFITPGLTVTERLQASLMPSNNANDYSTFYLLPPDPMYQRAISQATIRIINYHQFKPKASEGAPSRQQQQVIDGGSKPATPEQIAARTETPFQVISRITSAEGIPTTPFLVFNDEAHHCHQGNPGKDPEAKIWLDGIFDLHRYGFLHYVADFSATPIFLSQSTPQPFPWIVSDYSLIDAIEAGLVKIPQVPVSRSDAQKASYRDLYANSPSSQRQNFVPDDAQNNALLKEAINALGENHARRSTQSPIGQQPVFAIVMNSVKNANAVFDYISNGRAGLELLSNYADQSATEAHQLPRTIIVHSQLEEGTLPSAAPLAQRMRELATQYRSHKPYGFTERDGPEDIIRKVMNTVGRTGMPGEHIRCIISVSMLTEGWDAKNVTHLLGFRAFDSSLLCEQVAGRTLRRMTNDVDENTGLPIPEYAQVIGIPFPETEPPPANTCSRCGLTPNECDCPPQQVVHVEYRTDNPNLDIRWPNVTSLERIPNPDYLTVEINPSILPTAQTVPPHVDSPEILHGQVGEESKITSSQPYTIQRYLFSVSDRVSQAIVQEFSDDPESLGVYDRSTAIKNSVLFTQILAIAERLRQDGALAGPDEHGTWSGYDSDVQKTADWLRRLINVRAPHRVNDIRMRAVRGAAAPWLEAHDHRTQQTALKPTIYGPTKKSTITYAVCDSTWEATLARRLDETPEITRWIRNQRLGWSIPYISRREKHRYLPDFIAVAKLDEPIDLHLVIEVKGLEWELDPDKRLWAERYWIPTINADPEYGHAGGKHWHYLYITSLEQVHQINLIIQALCNDYNKPPEQAALIA